MIHKPLHTLSRLAASFWSEDLILWGCETREQALDAGKAALTGKDVATVRAEREEKEHPHQWSKDCLVSGADTPYICTVCGCKSIRRGLSWPPARTGKFKAEKWKHCK